MASEKMMILNMLQEGKITADEAAKLLSSVEDPNVGKSGPTVKPGPGRPDAKRVDSDPVSNSNRLGGAKPTSSGSSSGIDFDELGRKFAAFAKDLEPKFQKVTETVAEKTVTIADKLSKSLETATTPAPPRMPSSMAASPAVGTERHIELTVLDGYNELNLAGLNGDVLIKGYNGDKISAKIHYKAIRHGGVIDLIKLGGKYYLSYEEDEFKSVSIDAYVPSHMFNVINISSLNGNMEISGLNCGQLQISNTNGQLTLSDLSAENIKSESGNGRMAVRGITAATAVIEHFNGSVDAGEIDAQKLSLTNFNGAISMSNSAFDHYDEYLWSLDTSNAKLTLNVPTLPNLGYHIRSHATLGNIRIGLTGLEFLINDPSQIEARTASFDSKSKKVRLALETSNAPLTVN
ncbi:MAG: DUF4097 domain-containing protein [Defluviitaleaceae bacterium]|nr:DUF4097 domain-containing protein [Defluviitaleaceae bacterium]